MSVAVSARVCNDDARGKAQPMRPARRAPCAPGASRCPKCGAANALVSEPVAIVCALCGWRGQVVLKSERGWFGRHRSGSAPYAPDREDRATLWRQYRLDIQCGAITSREEALASPAAGRRFSAIESFGEPTRWFRKEVL